MGMNRFSWQPVSKSHPRNRRWMCPHVRHTPTRPRRQTELVPRFVREPVGKSDGIIPAHHRHRHALVAVIVRGPSRTFCTVLGSLRIYPSRNFPRTLHAVVRPQRVLLHSPGCPSGSSPWESGRTPYRGRLDQVWMGPAGTTGTTGVGTGYNRRRDGGDRLRWQVGGRRLTRLAGLK